MPRINSGQLVILCEEKHPRYINNQEIPNWQQGPTVSEAVNYLACKGWMLFSDPSALWLGSGKLTFIPPEYLFLLCEEKRPRYINGQEIPNWQQGPTVSEALNYLACKGWMPFSETSALHRGHGKLTLIRAKK